jgi:hypothetical protein
MSHSLRITVAAFWVVLALAGAAQAETLGSVRNTAVLLKIDAKPLPSLEAVVKIFAENGDNFVDWCTDWDDGKGGSRCFGKLDSGKFSNVHLFRTQIDFDRSGLNDSISLKVADIVTVELYEFPGLQEPFPYSLRIVMKPLNNVSTAYWFRVRTPGVGANLANALLSLPALAAGDLAPPAGTPVKLGVNARDLTPDEAKRAGATGGVYISDADAGSLAEQIGLKKGDALLEVDGVVITSVDALQRQLATGSIKAIVVWRDGKRLSLGVLSKL